MYAPLFPFQLNTVIYEAICSLGCILDPSFIDTPPTQPLFNGCLQQPLLAEALLGLCAHYWPELENELIALGSASEKPITTQSILDIIVVHESLKRGTQMLHSNTPASIQDGKTTSRALLTNLEHEIPESLRMN